MNYAATPKFATVVNQSAGYRENRDCTVKALAITTGVDYATAHNAMKVNGRRNRCGAYQHSTMGAIKMLGFEAIPVDTSEQGRTMKTVAAGLNPKGNFMVFVRGHVAAVSDGIVQDWSNGRQHRVKEIFEIVKVGEMPTQQTIRISDLPVVKAPVKPAPVKRGTVKAIIWARMDALWIQEGRPTEVRIVLKLRKQAMNLLELRGIKRSTASVQLGEWQKSKAIS